MDTATLNKSRTPRLISSLALCLALALAPAHAALADDDSDTNNTGQVLVKAGGGCVGGALLGSIVPIFGTAAGCVLGGLAGWWFSTDADDEAMEETTLVDGSPD